MGSYAQALEHKQALSDEEHEQKVDTLIDEMQKNQAKLSTLKDENGNPLPGYDETLGNLQNNFRDLRLLYDPKEHPGAIQRIGWKLTDALHLTKAADRQKKNEAREAVSPQDKFSAHSWAGAAPISPGQTEAEQTTADIAAQNAKNDATIDWLKKHGASQEVIDQAVASLAKVPTTKGTKAVGQPYQDANDHKWYQRYLNTDGTDYRIEVEGYTPKASGAGPIRAWKQDKDGKVISVLLDRNTNQEIPDSEDSSILPPPYLTQRLSTGVYHWVDENNQVHATPETHTSKPILPASSSAAATAPPTIASPKPNIDDVKAHATRLQGGSAARPRVSAIKDKILGYKSSAPLNHARQVDSDATKMASLADIWAKHAIEHPNSMSEEDGLFVLSLIRSEAGRVNQPEITQMFTAGGIAEAPERWGAKVGHGQLSTNLRNQLIEFTHDMKTASDEAVKDMEHSPGQTGGSTNPDVDAIVNALKKTAPSVAAQK